ncbi:MAG TPA: DNA-3-methyladenine glycosylase [Thermoplasmata archaeon]|nr:DNA-3-methyladenine glycosylase [Thermoplasmata archaeon]
MTEHRSATAARSSRAGAGPRAGRGFFDRPAAQLARDLLGATLTVRSGRVVRSVRIVETEAYVRDDPASHAFRGPTRRNRSMFSSPGTLYVYRIHQVVCANLVARRGEAVLLRAGAADRAAPERASGPGRLCRFLDITKEDDGTDTVVGDRVVVRLALRRAGPVRAGPRVGIRKAVDRRLRFVLADEPAVSRPRFRRPI